MEYPFAGSAIHVMSISQGQRLVRDYASQFETLLGRLGSYDKNMMLNQFIWGLQPELARSISLQYPKSITQAVSLAETTELAVKVHEGRLGRFQEEEIRQRAQSVQIGAKGNGEEMQDVAEGAVVEDEVYLGAEDAALVVEEEE